MRNTMKQLIYKHDKEIERHDLTEEEAKEVSDFLSNPNRSTHLNFRGQSLKAHQCEVRDINYDNSRERYVWSDDQLSDFEKEIYNNYDHFSDFLVAQNVIVINERYPHGAVKSDMSNIYTMYVKKYSAMMDWRYRTGKKIKPEQFLLIKNNLKN